MEKPIEELRRFAKQLGWRRLRLWQHGLDDGEVITCYIAGKSAGLRDDLFLQINEHPIGQIITYNACVYALRYRIVTGWHSMRLTPDGHCDDDEVRRLDARLHRRWFEALVNRRAYRTRYPECSGWSWGRIQHELIPISSDAKNSGSVR